MADDKESKLRRLRYLQLKAKSTESVGSEQPTDDSGIVSKVLNAVTEYPAGLFRVAASTPVGLAVADKDLYQSGDLGRALMMDAPTTKEYLTRAGAPEHLGLGEELTKVIGKASGAPQDRYPGKVYLGNGLDGKPILVSPKEALGGVGDFASQLGGAKWLDKLGALVKSGGEKIFSMPFRRQDAVLSESGKPLLSDMIREGGHTPLTKQGILDATAAEAQKRVVGVDALERPVIESGATGRMSSAVSRMQEQANRLLSSNSPYDQELGKRIQMEVNAHLALGEQAAIPAVPSKTITNQVQTGVNEWTGQPIFEATKTTIPGRPAVPAVPGPGLKGLNEVKTGAWRNRPKDISSEEWKVYNALGGGAAEEGKRLANSVISGQGDKIYNMNQELSGLLMTLPDVERKALLEASKAPITEIDLMSLVDPNLFSLKQAGKIAKTPGFFTVPGRAAMSTGTAISGNAPFVPWLNILNKAKGNQ